MAEVDTWEGPEPKPNRREIRKVTLVDSEEGESNEESDINNRIKAPMILESLDQTRELITPENQGVGIWADDKLPPPSTGEKTSGSQRMKYLSPSFAGSCESRKETHKQERYLLSHG